MSVSDIHPEELIDKRMAGSLSASEAAHLDAHLARCEACRFELSLRNDLEDDVAAHRLALPPQLLSQVPAVGPRAAPRRLRRLSLAWIAAAAVFVLAAGALGAYAAPRVWPWVQRVENSSPTSPPNAAAAPARKARESRERAALSAASAAASAACPTPSSEAALPVAAQPVAALPVAANQPPVAHSRAPRGGTAALANDGAEDEDSAQALFSAANRARRSGQVAHASDLYRTLQRKFPRSPEAALSRVTLATLLLNRDPAGALASFDAYLASGAQPLTSEALVGRARALRALGRGAEARRAWQEVLQRYPTSVYAVEAREAVASANGP